jgi:hypothetical protein
LACDQEQLGGKPKFISHKLFKNRIAAQMQEIQAKILLAYTVQAKTPNHSQVSAYESKKLLAVEKAVV